MTSGSTAMARAMHRRCCWPPDRPERALVEAVLRLVPERGAAQAPLDDRIEVALPVDPLDAAAERDVLVDRLRERIRFLEDHPDPAPQRVDVQVGIVDVLPFEEDRSRRPHAVDEVVHPVEAAQQRGLAAARRADERRDPLLRDLEGDLAERPRRSVPERERLDGQDRSLDHSALPAYFRRNRFLSSDRGEVDDRDDGDQEQRGREHERLRRLDVRGLKADVVDVEARDA